MEHFNAEVKMTSFGVNVETPMHNSIMFVKELDTTQWENVFIHLRDDEAEYEKKRNYDRCRIILKYAYSCGGELKQISNVRNKIVFTIVFDNIQGLNEFQKNLEEVVKTATM